MEIQFTIPDKYEDKKQLVKRMITKYQGSFNITETKNDSFFIVEFKEETTGRVFRKELDALIPDLHKY